MKTLFLYEETHHENYFFELEGDFSRFNGIYIGQMGNDALQDELTSLIYTEAGEIRDHIKRLEVPTKDWAFFVKCGFLC